MIQIKRLTTTAKLPERAYSDDAGWDLFCDINVELNDDSDGSVWVQPGDRVLLSTGCAFAIPKGYYGRIADRSGNAWKYGLHVLGGVVDSKYRGEVKVILFNTNDQVHEIKNGDKVAQMIITKISNRDMVEVDSFVETEGDEVNKMRGNRGFGSSGR